MIRADYIGDATRSLLLVMAMSMTDRGRVSVPRSELARVLNRHEQRIADRIKEARAAGLLDQIGGGYRGRTAEYEALLPSGKGTAQTYPIDRKRTGFRYPNIGTLSGPNQGLMGTAQTPPIARVTKNDRQNQPTHHDSRGETDHGENHRRSDEQAPINSPLVAAFPITPSTETDIAS